MLLQAYYIQNASHTRGSVGKSISMLDLKQYAQSCKTLAEWFTKVAVGTAEAGGISVDAGHPLARDAYYLMLLPCKTFTVMIGRLCEQRYFRMLDLELLSALF